MIQPYKDADNNQPRCDDGKEKDVSQRTLRKSRHHLINLSILKTGKAKAIRFSTLEAICQALDCQPADLMEYRSTSV